MAAANYITFRYSGGGKGYIGPDYAAAVASAKEWAEGQDAGAAVYDADANIVFSQIGTEEQVAVDRQALHAGGEAQQAGEAAAKARAKAARRRGGV